MQSVEDKPADKTLELSTETLKTLRLLHQILMIVAGTILAFSLRPDPSNDLNAALEELTALRQLRLDGYPLFVDKRYASHRDQQYSHLKETARKAGARVAPQPAFQQPAFVERPPVSTTDSRLLELEAFFVSTKDIAPIVIDSDNNRLQERLHVALTEKAPQQTPTLTGIEFSGGETPYPTGVRMLGFPNRAVNNVATLNFIFNEFQPGLPSQAISIQLPITYSVGKVETGQFALEWLRTDDIGRRLLDTKSGMVFPHLKQFWGRVGIMVVDQATLFLQQSLEKMSQGTISFFGIPVDPNLAISAGPVICVSLLIFFLLHLRHLRTTDISALRKYPWVGLFSDLYAGILSYASLLLLPLVANGLLLHRYGKFRESSTTVGLVAMVLLVLISVITASEMRRLRKTIG